MSRRLEFEIRLLLKSRYCTYNYGWLGQPPASYWGWSLYGAEYLRHNSGPCASECVQNYTVELLRTGPSRSLFSRTLRDTSSKYRASSQPSGSVWRQTDHAACFQASLPPSSCFMIMTHLRLVLAWFVLVAVPASQCGWGCTQARCPRCCCPWSALLGSTSFRDGGAEVGAPGEMTRCPWPCPGLGVQAPRSSAPAGPREVSDIAVHSCQALCGSSGDWLYDSAVYLKTLTGERAVFVTCTCAPDNEPWHGLRVERVDPRHRGEGSLSPSSRL